MSRVVSSVVAASIVWGAQACGCNARSVENTTCDVASHCPQGSWCVSGACVSKPWHDGSTDIAMQADDDSDDSDATPGDRDDSTSEAEAGVGDGDVLDAGCLDVGPDTGPDVAVWDMCTGARPDGGVMDVTPSCGPSPTGKGGEMCRVPGGPFWMGIDPEDCLGGPCGGALPFRQVVVPTFEMHRFEVTVADFAECVADGACDSPRCQVLPDYEEPLSNSEIPGREDHPVNCVDWYQASTYCWWAGKRLPSEAEWEKAARGTDGRQYPWGNERPDCDRGVFGPSDCGVGNTAPVGSKPAGASPYGIEDLVGNVFEWTSDECLYDYYHAPADGLSYLSNSATVDGSGPYCYRSTDSWPEPSWYDDPGGAEFYLTSITRSGFAAEEVNVGTGFRCVVSGDDGAHGYDSAAWQSRRDSIAMTGSRKLALEDRSQPDGGAEDAGISFACATSPTGWGGEMCDVPEGPFPMGCEDIVTGPNSVYKGCYRYTDEIPAHDVWLSGYKIDRFEVTAGEYQECVMAGGCGLPGNVNFVCNERCTYDLEGWERHPINCVLWEQAKDYCAWAGKRLPTEAEWEKAAGGPEGWYWPWGNDIAIAGSNLACDYAVLCPPQYGPWHVEPVGTKPKGVTPYGALDMIGNVWEWTNDWYDENYYANSPTVDPLGPSSGYFHVLRGGSPNYPFNDSDNKTRLAVFHPAYWSETVGFRCAY